MAFFLAGLHWPLDKTTTATPQCAPPPLPSSPDVIVIEEEPEADREPDFQVLEVLREK